MGEPDQEPQHDGETQELLRVAKRMSRHMGIPVAVLVASITRLVAAEQLKVETLNESKSCPDDADGDSPA